MDAKDFFEGSSGGFSAEAASCKLRYRFGESLVYNATDADAGFVYSKSIFFGPRDSIVSFPQVAKIQVMPIGDWFTLRTGIRFQTIEPNIFALVLTLTHGNRKSFYFADPATADRVAKAMLRAVELCGGGSTDPF